jgi:hypothetical protein
MAARSSRARSLTADFSDTESSSTGIGLSYRFNSETATCHENSFRYLSTVRMVPNLRTPRARFDACFFRIERSSKSAKTWLRAKAWRSVIWLASLYSPGLRSPTCDRQFIHDRRSERGNAPHVWLALVRRLLVLCCQLHSFGAVASAFTLTHASPTRVRDVCPADAERVVEVPSQART